MTGSIRSRRDGERMETRSIKVVAVGKGIRAYVIIYHDGTNYEGVIEEPYSDQPYYMLDGARHDLTDHQKKRLRETIAEVRGK